MRRDEICGVPTGRRRGIAGAWIGAVAVLASTVLVTVGCQSGATGPSSGQPPANPATTRAYLDALMTRMETSSVNRDTIDWASFRAQVIAKAGDAGRIPDLYPAIDLALQLLRDYESFYGTSTGSTIGPAPVGGCGAAPAPPPALPATIAHVRIESCDCEGNAATQFAESIQRAIKAADRDGLAGWIVDLRGNFGGNMWPMIAGVGPVLGEGLIGWIIYNNREYEREYRDGAALSLNEPFTRVAAPYTLLRPHPKVAVLTDGGVSSAGNAITIFFKGRPDTRSFGTPTCVHHHLLERFVLTDGARLELVTAQQADRTKRRFAGPIEPDETITDPAAAIARAIAWLQGGE